MKKIGVFFVALTLCFSLGGCFAKPQAPAESAETLDVSSEAELTVHALSEISFQVPDWARQGVSDYDRQLQFGGQNESLLVSSSPGNSSASTEKFAKGLVAYNLESFASQNMQAGELESQTINGTNWIKVFYTLSGDDGTEKELVSYMLSTKNGQYSCTFLYDAGTESKLAELVVPTLVLDPDAEEISDSTGAEESGLKASENLIGEWDAGEQGGYLVFFENGQFAWYKSSSMSEDNVMSGTYIIGDELVPLVENTYGGFEVEMTFDKMVIDGEEQQSGHTYHYEFFSYNKPNYFWIEHIDRNVHFEINKVA